jgi:hypothetical protein
MHFILESQNFVKVVQQTCMFPREFRPIDPFGCVASTALQLNATFA